MAKNRSNNSSNDSSSTEDLDITNEPATEDQMATQEPPAKLAPYRVLIADTSDDKHPHVRVLEVCAESMDRAYEIVEGLDNKFSPGVPGIGILPLMLEEALPFLREGFALRRDTWPRAHVMLRHTHINTRLDRYLRHVEYPDQSVQHLGEAALVDADIMSADWSVCARPPNFAKV